MSVNWIALFDAHGVPYASSGPNVGRGHVAVHCPFCGADDSGMHLSVSLHGKGYRCWRRPHQHKGASPAKLIRALLRCSWERAVQLAGGDVVAMPDDFESAVMRHLAAPAAVRRAKPLALPAEFLRFKEQHGRPDRPYVNYMIRRLYSEQQLSLLSRDYHIKYARMGADGGRIIFPVYFKGELVTWTGRTIGRSTLRYRTLGYDPEQDDPCAVGPISDYLLWFDDLIKSNAHTCVYCEGPFDALRVSVLGRRHGVVGTCFFTAAPTVRQIELMHLLAPTFEHNFLLLDQNALPSILSVTSDLKSLGIDPLFLSPEFKDPGELTERGFARLFVDSHVTTA